MTMDSDDTILPDPGSDDTILPDNPAAPRKEVAPDDRTIISDPGDGTGGGGSAVIREFSHYTLIQELGRGAQGVVYLAEDRNLGRKVALKMLSGTQSQTQRNRFRREAEVASRLDHPGICGVLEIGEEEDIPYIAMQYVRGVPLDQLVGRARSSQENDATIRDVSRSLTGESIASIMGTPGQRTRAQSRPPPAGRPWTWHG